MKKQSLYTDPEKKGFKWIHDEGGVSFCYFNIFLLNCTMLPNMEPEIFGALTHYIHSGLPLYTLVGVAFDNLSPIRINHVTL